MSNKTAFALITIAILLIGLAGWFVHDDCKLVEVKLIKIVETNPSEGAWTRIPTYAIYETVDNHERITGHVYGKEGETFKIRNGYLR